MGSVQDRSLRPSCLAPHAARPLLPSCHGFSPAAPLLYSVPVTPRSGLAISLLTSVVALSSGLSAPALSAPVPTLTPDQIPAGSKAIVKTVFEGSKVEEFEAEIVGVLRGGRTEGDLIIGRATSERVVKSGIAQGMSGSPVYVDGKLVGALSSGWPFAREPLFGITPIGEMLDVLERPSPAPTGDTPGPTGIEATGLSAGSRFREFRWDGEGESPPGGVSPASTPADAAASAAGGDRGPSTGLTWLGLPLSCGSLHPEAMDLARRMLATHGLVPVPGGRATGKGPTGASLEPGSAVAVELMRGDIQIAAIGTLTYRDGDRVLLFGHPFFQSGDVRLPLATAEIATVVSSQQFSFKLGVRGREAGVVTQDRRAAVGGVIGGAPRLLPVTVEIRGERREPQRFHFESIEDRTLAPTLVAIASINSLLESGGVGASQTLRWRIALYRHGTAALVLSDVAAGDAPTVDLTAGVGAPLRLLFNNPYARLSLDSLGVSIDVEPGRQQWTIRRAQVLDAAVRPGGRVRIQCEVERWRGARESRSMTLDVPEEAPDGRYTLWIGGGSELSHYEATRLPGRYRPTSLDDAWSRLSSSRSSDGLYAALFARAPEVTSEGRDYPELPLSALPLLTSEQTTGDRARRGDLAKLAETRLSIGGEVHGELAVNVVVDSNAP